MRATLWIGLGLLIVLLSGVASVRGFGRATFWLLVGGVGLGVCCGLLGILSLDAPPVGDDLWVRLLWSTAAWTGPAWVAFSLHFARPERTKPADVQRLLLFLLWSGAVGILILGLVRPPMEVVRPAEGSPLLRLHAPAGRLFIVHAIAAVGLMLWNLHATLEAARAIGRRRTAQAIYALLPIVIFGLYGLAEFLLYGVVSRQSGDLLLGATLLSTVAVVVAVRGVSLRQLSLPAGHLPRPSSAVLSGLGAFFVGLALLAEAVRWIGRPSEAIWYERAAVALLVVLLALWIFPGLRCELRRLLDRGGLVSFAASRETIEKMARALAPAERAGDLAIALRILLRERLGPITAHLWISAPLTDRFEPAEPTGPVGLGREHPLVTELERRSGALVLSGGASRIREIVLHVACEEIAERHGLRVLLPIRHHGTLVAILGAGGTAERTLHPEDIDLLEELAAEIGPLAAGVALEERAFPPRGTDSRPIAAVAEAAGSTWLDALLSERQGDSQSAPLRLLVSGADRVCRTPGFADPLLRSLFREAAERAAEGRAPAEVRIGLLPRDRLQVELPGDGGGRIVLRLVDPLALRRGEPAPGGGDDV